MFTGIIIEKGLIKDIKRKDNEIEMVIFSKKISSFKEGMSISCAGICLTVVSFENYERLRSFHVYASRNHVGFERWYRSI